MPLGRFIKSFASRWGAASAAVTAGPLGLLAADLAPPWPSENGVAAAALGCIAGIIGLIFAFSNKSENAQRTRATKRSLMSAGILVIVFIALWSVLIVSIPQFVDGSQVYRRFLTGFYTTDLGASVSRDVAIKRYGLGAVYSPMSLLLARLVVVSTWMLIVGLLTFGFGLQQAREDSGNGG
jgi:hypothetical protein